MRKILLFILMMSCSLAPLIAEQDNSQSGDDTGIESLSNFRLFSQVTITTSTNTLRHGDILCKIEVPYVEQGERGSESIRNLPEIPDNGMEYLQAISACSSDPTIDDNAGNTEERPNVMKVSGNWSLTAQRSVLTVSLDVYIDIV